MIQLPDCVDEDTGRIRQGDKEIMVLAENWDAVMLYQRCQPVVILGPAGAVHQGVSAAELRSVLVLQRVPRQRWPELADQIGEIGNHYARQMNLPPSERKQ